MRQENECSIDSWSLIPFKSNIEMLSGFPFDSSLFNAGDGLPLIRIRNIISGKTDTYFSGKYSDEYVIKEGDILVGMDGDFHIRKWKGTKALLNQRILKLYECPESQINLEFFYYLAQPFLLMVHQRTSGTTVKHLSTKDFRNASFRIPTYKEQQKIAEILSTVDEKIDTIDQKIKETEALKKGMMQRLLTKGIGHTQFKDSPLGEIPESWEVVELVSHIKLLSGFAFKSDGFNEDGQGTKLLRGINITQGKLRWNEKLDRWWDLPFDDFDKYSAKPGDLVISMDGSLVGRNYARVKEEDLPLLIVQRVASLRAKPTLDLEFLNQIIGSPLWLNFVDAVKTSSGIPHISSKNIKEFRIPFPSKTEQTQIATILSQIDSKMEILDTKKDSYIDLKKGLMQKLLTGKIRVNSLIENEATA